MIQWVWEAAGRAKLLDRVLVATDDDRVREACAAFGAPVVMTSPHHRSGTDRAAEAAGRAGAADIVVNIQGDEPLLDPRMIDALVEALQDPGVPMATLMRREADPAAAWDENRVKVVVDRSGRALYFSRSPVPYQAADFLYVHVGIYGYQKPFLETFCRLAPTRLEKIERLEQLRALEHGHAIRMVETTFRSLSVDVPRDIIEVEKIIESGSG